MEDESDEELLRFCFFLFSFFTTLLAGCFCVLTEFLRRTNDRLESSIGSTCLPTDSAVFAVLGRPPCGVGLGRVETSFCRIRQNFPSVAYKPEPQTKMRSTTGGH